MAPRTETVMQRSALENVVLEQSEPYERIFVWQNVVKISLVHLMALYGCYEYFYSMWQTHIFGIWHRPLHHKSTALRQHEICKKLSAPPILMLN